MLDFIKDSIAAVIFCGVLFFGLLFISVLVIFIANLVGGTIQ